MIRLRGARQHHLHDLDLDLVPGTWAAIVGPSGSGKTSLVHDTVVAEGRRRWLSLLSGPARKLLGKAARPHVDRLEGLPLPVAIRSAAGGSVRSTVGTRSGLLDLLRLVWAREGDPAGLTRSHFSFNHPRGSCEACQGLGVQDQVDPELLVADPSLSLRAGALVPTLKSGYTVYSQVTVDVMDQLCRAYGFTVDTPWRDLSDEQRHMVLYGTDRLVVPFGKHDLASRMTWAGITARPREEGHYKGLVPVIETTLARSRNPNILRFVRTVPCEACDGERLGIDGRRAEVQGQRLPPLLDTPLHQLDATWSAVLTTPTGRAVASNLRGRLQRLLDLDLGHLTLARELPSLSGGEAQRLAFAALLGTELSNLLFAFDEPTLGLHPDAQPGLHRAIEAIRARGNTVLTVEHDPDFVRLADRVVALGPGSGQEGGRVTRDGPPTDDPLGGPPTPRTPRPGQGTLWLRGATRHNLQGDDFPVLLGAFTVVLGRSGAGKSTLVMGCLQDALRGRSTVQLDGPMLPVVAVDASPLGRTPRSTPATWTGWFDTLRKRFAATEQARTLGLGASAFAYNGKAGRCEGCQGLGVERIRLHLLEDLLRPCPTCSGSRYRAEPLAVRWRGHTIADVLRLPVDAALEAFGDDEGLRPVLQALHDLGLGHLPLGQPSPTLSRGEAQRVRLATTLAKTGSEPMVLLLDEPDRGLHPSDLTRLIAAFDRLVDAGHTLVAISHHRHLWAAADRRIRVHDGRLELDPAVDWQRLTTTSTREPCHPPDHLSLHGVRTHHLKGFDLQLPHRALVGIVGVSGSGKSSLAMATLAAEAERRLAETLPFAVRRHLRRVGTPMLDGATGLSPTLVLEQGGPSSNPTRSTVGTALDVDPLLRLLFARATTGFTAAHFSPNRPEGACPSCHGRGARTVATKSGLLTHPERPLTDGALQGTKTGRYLGEPDGQYLATLRAALVHAGHDPACLDRPLDQLPDAVRQIAWQGSGDVELDVRWSYTRGKRSGTHTFQGPWPGLLALADREAQRRSARKDAASWASHLEEQPCEACVGQGLASGPLNATIDGMGIGQLRAHAVSDLLTTWDCLEDERGVRVARALRPELARRLDDAVALGLGGVRLDTSVGRLADGDRQRLRLAGVLGAGLTGLTLVLDEPDAGLPDDALPMLLSRLKGAVDDGNTVIVVTHRQALMEGMDHLVELGPGSGPDGGRVVAQGTVAELRRADTPTGRLLRAEREPPQLSCWQPHEGHDGPALRRVADRHTLPALDPARVHAVLPVDRRQTVLDATGCASALQRLYAAHGELPPKAFNWRSPAGRCPTCKGSGVETVGLDVLADLELPCPTCDGRRYRPEVLAVSWPATGDAVVDWLRRPARQLIAPLSAATGKHARTLADACQRLVRLGLGGLAFGRALSTLSGGERQRLLVASVPSTPHHIVVEHPDRGLHDADLAQVATYLHDLVDAGHGVWIVGARPRFAAALATEASQTGVPS